MLRKKEEVVMRVVCFLCVVIFCVQPNPKLLESSPRVRKASPPRVAPPQVGWKRANPKNILISAVGDVMMGTDRVKLRARGKYLLQACAPYLQGFDINFYNNEGTFAKANVKPNKRSIPGISYVFRSPRIYATWLAKAGFNMASLANNHSYDYGWKGLYQTARLLRRSGIVSSHNFGTTAKRTIRGTRIVMVAFHTSRYGKHCVNKIPQAKEIVQKLARTFDIVMVSFHGGAEGTKHIHVPKKLERYLGERRGNVHAFAHGVIDAGADLVIGHGPHVPRAMEIYKGRLIAYSLGNFVTTGFGLRSYKGYAPMLQVELSPKGKLIQGRVLSFLQRRYRGVALDPSKKAAHLIHKLGKADFPKSNAVNAKGLIEVPKQVASEPPIR